MNKIINLKDKYFLIFPLILLIILFCNVLVSNNTLFYRDLFLQDYPLTEFVKKSIFNGEFPLWNQYLFSGLEQFASLQPPLFYPFFYTFLIFPFHIALIINLIIHYYLSFYGVYLVAKNWNLSTSSAFISGIIFTLSSYTFELYSFQYILYAISWIPFIFLFSDKFIKNNTLNNFLFIVLFSSLQIASGRLDYFYLTITLVSIYFIITILFSSNKKNDLSSIFFIFTAFTISSLIVSPQIILSILFINTTIRVDSLDLSIATIWSIHPLQLLNIFFNNLWGDIFSDKYLTKIISDRKNPSFFVYNLYLGLGSILLFSSIFIKKEPYKNIIKNKNTQRILFLLTTLLVYLFISLGKYTFFYEFLYYYLPGFSMTRYPSKIFIYSIFSISLLSGFGFENIKNKKNQKQLILLLIPLNLILLSFVVILLLFNVEILSYLNSFIDQKVDNINFVIKSVSDLVFIILSFSIILYLYYKEKIRSEAFIYLTVLLISFDLLSKNLNNLWVVPTELFYSKSDIVNIIEKNIGNKLDYQIYHEKEENVITLDKSKILSDFKNILFSNNYNLSTLYSIHNAFGYYPGEPKKIALIFSALNGEIDGLYISDKEKASLFKMMGVRFIIRHKNNDNKDSLLNNNYFKLIERAYNIDIWEVKDYKPRITFKSKALVTINEEEILKAVLKSDLYGISDDIVFIKDNSNYKKSLSLVKKEPINNTIKNDLKIVNENSNSLEIKALVNTSGYLCLSQRFNTDWIAYDNEIETPILESNYFQQAIRVSSGEHNIKFLYKPKLFYLSLKISIFTILSLLVFIFIYLKLPKEIYNKLKTAVFFDLVPALITSFVIIFIPLIINYSNLPNDKSFIPFDSSFNEIEIAQDSDLFTYISKMRQGYDGDLLYTNKYTLEQSYPTALFIFYTILGKISYILGLNLFIFYFLSAFIFSVILFIISKKFISLFFSEEKISLLNTIFLFFSMGLSFLYKIFPKTFENASLPADIIYPELSIFTSIVDVPHFTFSISLMLLIYYSVIKIPKKFIFITIYLFILALIHPFDFVTVFLVSSTYIIIQLLKKNALYIKNIYKFIFSFTISLLPILYIYYVLNDNLVLNLTLKSTNILKSPSIFSYFIGYGIWLILFVISIFYLYKKKIDFNDKILFLLTWIIANFMLLYLPFDFQRRFMMGLQIPIIIMGFTCFIEIVKNKNKYFKTAIISILILLSIPSSIIVFNSRAQNKSWNIDKDLTNMFEWINNNKISNKNFLSHSYIGNLTPAFTSNRTYVGHWSESIDFNNRKNFVKEFFKSNNNFKIKFLNKHNINYVVYGPIEKSLGNLDINIFKRVYSIGEYDLVKVKND